MSITTETIKLLREATGAGILDCKKALQETDGDMDKAIEYLRKKGLAAAAKKASREAKEGLVSAHISADGQTAVMVEVNCETDFVARTDDFQQFVAALVRQVAANAQLNSPEALMVAPFIDNTAKTVVEYLNEVIAKLGENMIIRRVARFDLAGAGMLDQYIHFGGRVGVLIEASGSTAANPKFAGLVHDLALHIAAASPRYVTVQDVPAEAVEAEKSIYRGQLAEDKKPDNIKEKIIEGKLKKWYEEVVLLEQPFVKDNELTIIQLLEKYGKELGSSLQVRRFARFELGAN